MKNALDLLAQDAARTDRAVGAQVRQIFGAPREQRSDTSRLDQPSEWLMQAMLAGPTKSGASVNEQTAFNVSVVRACVDVRALLIAMLPVKVFKKTARGPQEQRDHPLAKLLRRKVGPGQTSFKWRYASQVCHDIGGNAYSRITRNGFAEVESIRFLKPVDVAVLENKQTGAVGFRLSGVGDLRDYEVLHVANLSTNGLTGRSPLHDLREAVGLAMTAEEFSARSFANGNRKPGILQGGQAMTSSKAQEFLQFWMRNYAGASNAGKSPFVYGGVEWKDAGFSNQDAELLLTRKFSVEEVARVYHLPLHLIGSTEKATTWGSGVEQLNRGLVDYTLQPICTNWEAEMNTTLLTEQEQDEGYYVKFVVDALLRGSFESRAKIYQIMRGIRAMSVNEIRSLEEMEEAADTGANNLDWPMNNQGGGGAPAPAPAAASATED